MDGRLTLALACLICVLGRYGQADDHALRVRVDSESIRIEGNVASIAQETLLAAAARADPSARTVETDVTVRGDLPANWMLIAELTIRAAVFLEQGEAMVGLEAVEVEGGTREPEQLQEALAWLDAVLLPGMEKRQRVYAVSARRDPLDVLCRRQFFAITRENSVDFVSGGASLQESAHPVLDRLVELMAECPSLTVTVTGHTDAVGDDDVNREIRRKRADAVLGYIEGRGISPDRIRAVAADALEAGDPLPPVSPGRRVEFALDAP